MTDNDNTTLSRRKLLGAAATVGAAGALGGTGTSALLWDEEKFGNVDVPNVLQGGELDLKVDWEVRYYDWMDDTAPDADDQGSRGRIDATSADEVGAENGLVDQPGPLVNLVDLKPGDVVEKTLSVHLFGNPGWLTMAGEITVDDDNGVTEPEDKENGHTPDGEDSTPGDGDLDDLMECLVWYDGDDDGDDDTTDPGNNFPEEILADGEAYSPADRSAFVMDLADGEVEFDETADAFLFRGSLRDLFSALQDGLLLEPGDDVAGDFPSSRCFDNSTTHYLGMLCWLPRDIPGYNDNIVQTDRVEYYFGFGAEQCRHNVHDLSTGAADWQVTASPDGTTGDAQVITPHPAWTTSDCADWVNPYGGGGEVNQPDGSYTYELQFDAPSADCTLFVNEYAADNTLELSLDGETLAASNAEDNFSSLSGPLAAVELSPGSHTLTADIENITASPNPTGFLACASVYCDEDPDAEGDNEF